MCVQEKQQAKLAPRESKDAQGGYWLDESPLHLAECDSQQLEEIVTFDGTVASMVDCATQGSARLMTINIREELTVTDTVMESSLWQTLGRSSVPRGPG